MKNNSMNKMKRTMKNRWKSNVLVEMAEDFKDLITNAESIQKINEKKIIYFQYGPRKSRAIFIKWG